MTVSDNLLLTFAVSISKLFSKVETDKLFQENVLMSILTC